MTGLVGLLLATGIALGPTPADVAARPPSLGGAIHQIIIIHRTYKRIGDLFRVEISGKQRIAFVR